jgi:broad specificity phosphatase PhoE
MSRLRRLVMVRHGETDGNSSVRFHGSGDVPLSDAGRAQMRAARAALNGEVCELVVASPLRRSWEGAAIVAPGTAVRLEADFREIDFGRWEGLTAQEIKDSDPVLYEDWQARAPGFEYPGGERRQAFLERVHRGLARIEQSGASGALLVGHKGVIRAIAQKLTGKPLEDGEPPLAGIVWLSRAADDSWFAGRRSSNPPGLEPDA